MPSVKVDDRIVGIIHVSQLYSLLGLARPADLGERRRAWDLVTMQQIWLSVIRPLEWATILAPTPSRGRSIRELAVNVFQMFRPLQTAWETGRFVIDVPSEMAIVQSLDAPRLAHYLEEIALEWEAFVLEHDDRQPPSERTTRVWRTTDSGERTLLGELPFGGVLAFVANHTAGHLRQVAAVLDRSGIPHAPDRLERFDVELAADPFDEAAQAPFRL
jgi:hypothetical protein